MSAFAPPLIAQAPPAQREVSSAGPKGRPWLHALVLATATGILLWPITLAVAVLAGSAAAAGGTFLAERLHHKRYRLWVVGTGALVFAAFAQLVLLLLSDSQLSGELIGPVALIQLVEMLRFGSVALSASLVVRAAAIRYRAALALEGSLAVLAVASTVSAHRDGMIARPLDVSDWFWSQGLDPVAAFLGIGLVAALLFAGILAYGRSGKRTLLQLLIVVLLGLFFALRIHGRDPSVEQKNAVGNKLQKEKDDQRQGKGGGGSGNSNDNARPNEDLPSNSQGSQNRPAAIVVFHKDVMPAGGVFYFRHGAFSQFNGTRLVEATIPGLDLEGRHAFPTQPEAIAGAQNESEERSEVATDVALLTDHSRMFTLIDPVQVEPMPNPEPARFRRAYRVVSRVLTDGYSNLLDRDAGDPSWSDEVWAHYTEFPRQDARYADLAANIKAGVNADYKNDPVALALSVKSYLEQTSTYSFKRSYSGSQDPTADFLFSEDKRGYCVHLSHAAAYLLRALGVPARVSAGYAVPAANLAGGSALLIKQGDSHAWAEIYLRGVGWVPIEVTPEKSDVEQSAFEEKDLQQLLGEMARKEGRFERSSAKGPRLMDILNKLMGYVPYLLLGLLAVAYGIKSWRLLAPHVLPARAGPRVAYRAGLDRLAMSGFLRQRGEPREGFALRVQPASPSFSPLTAVHVGAVFGASDPLAPAGERKLSQLAGAVGQEVRKAVPWWRWLIGVLNPVSWLWSR